MRKRVYAYDNYKCILMYLVVLGHCIEPHVDQSSLLKSTFLIIYLFHMPAFFFITGIFSRGTIDKWESVKRKIGYYLSLYVALKILLFLLDALCFHKVFFQLLITPDLPWFMLVMAYYYAITYLTRKWNPVCFFVLAILCGCIAGYNNNIGDFLCLSRTFAFYPFFLAGYYLDRYLLSPMELLRLTDRFVIKMTAGISLLLLVSVGYIRLKDFYPYRPLFTGRNPFARLPHPALGGIDRMIYYVLVVFIILCILALIPRRKMPFTAMGSRTLQVYFLHFAILYPLRAIGYFTKILELTDNHFMWLASFPITALIIDCFLSTRLVERIFEKVFSVYNKNPFRRKENDR